MFRLLVDFMISLKSCWIRIKLWHIQSSYLIKFPNLFSSIIYGPIHATTHHFVLHRNFPMSGTRFGLQSASCSHEHTRIMSGTVSVICTKQSSENFYISICQIILRKLKFTFELQYLWKYFLSVNGFHWNHNRNTITQRELQIPQKHGAKKQRVSTQGFSLRNVAWMARALLGNGPVNTLPRRRSEVTFQKY
jgi:hypothetical protein